MASNDFKNLRAKTTAVTKPKKSVSDEIGAEKAKKLLSESLVIQTELKNQFKVIKKDYKKNKNIYDALHNEVVMLRKKRDGPKFRKGLNFFDRFKGGGGKGGGLLGSLMSAFGIAGMFLKPFKSMFKKGMGQILKGVRAALTSLLRGMGKAGLKAIQALGRGGIAGAKTLASGAKDLGIRSFNAVKNSNILRGAGRAAKSGVQRAVSAGARLVSPGGLGRAGMRQVAGLIGRGVIGMAGAAMGYPLLIATAAAAVGYGTYKLGRYLKLSEKLDEFIKKVSGGKYTNLVDFILGITNGTVGKELYGWVKDKISTMFTDAIKFLKEKTSEILGKFSPFPNDSDDREAKDGDKSVVGGGEAAQLGANKASGDVAVTDNKSEGTTSGESDGGSMWDKIKAGAGSAVQSVRDALSGSEVESNGDIVEGTYANNPDIQHSNDLAWKAITKGKNTHVTSHYRTKHRPGHNGIDIAAEIGTPLYALEDGIVASNWHSGGGNQAIITGTASGYSYAHAHLSKILVKSGKIRKGDVIGLSGNTGKSTGPHIHFGMRKNGVRINPIDVKTVISAQSKVKEKTGEGDMHWPDEKISAADSKNSTSKSLSSNFVGANTGDSIGSIFSKPQQVEAAMPDVLNRITNIVSGKDKDYLGLAKSLFDVILKNDKQHEDLSESMQQPTAQPQRQPQMMAPPQATAQSKAGAISGKEGEVQDPRGALNSQIVLACYSALFV